VQASRAGQSSALSAALTLGAGRDTAIVELLVPSPLLVAAVEGRRADRLSVVTEDFVLPAAAAAAMRGFAFCDMILVVVDGNEVPGGGDMLLGMTGTDLESVEYLPPIEAGARYGIQAAIQGALVLWTRGRGPHARRER
jgi:hypothetical protein